jgi:hypothetical protein
MKDVNTTHRTAFAVAVTILIGSLCARATSAQSVHGTAAVMSIGHTVEKIEDEDTAAVRKNDLRELDRLWSDDLTVNNPNNRILGKQEVFGFMKKRSRLQYESYERPREGTVHSKTARRWKDGCNVAASSQIRPAIPC